MAWHGGITLRYLRNKSRYWCISCDSIQLDFPLSLDRGAFFSSQGRSFCADMPSSCRFAHSNHSKSSIYCCAEVHLGSQWYLNSEKVSTENCWSLDDGLLKWFFWKMYSLHLVVSHAKGYHRREGGPGLKTRFFQYIFGVGWNPAKLRCKHPTWLVSWSLFSYEKYYKKTRNLQHAFLLFLS